MSNRLEALLLALSTDPQAFTAYEDLENAFTDGFYPTLPRGVLVQFYILSAIFALLLAIALSSIWVRRGYLTPFRRVGDMLIPNAAIVFSSLIALWLAFAQPTIWKTINILRGDGGFKDTMLLRGFCWTLLWLAGYYKTYCTLLSSNRNSRATNIDTRMAQVNQHDQQKEQRQKIKISSLMAAFFLPFLFTATLFPINVWANKQCNDAYNTVIGARDITRSFETNPERNGQEFLVALSTLLENLNGNTKQCILWTRIVYFGLAIWTALLVIAAFIPYLILQKKISRQIKVLQYVDHDFRRIPQSQKQDIQLSTSVTDSADKARKLKVALVNLQIQAIGLFGCSLCYIVGSLLVGFYGARAQSDGNVLAGITLLDFWAFVIFGTPAQVACLYTGITRGSFIGASSSLPSRHPQQFLQESGDPAQGQFHKDLGDDHPIELINPRQNNLTDDEMDELYSTTTKTEKGSLSISNRGEAFVPLEVPIMNINSPSVEGRQWFSQGKPSEWTQ